jgi:prevent-host-death family protein
MHSVNVAELKNQLCKYLTFAKSGEEIVIRVRNLPVAKLLPTRRRMRVRYYAVLQWLEKCVWVNRYLWDQRRKYGQETEKDERHGRKGHQVHRS